MRRPSESRSAAPGAAASLSLDLVESSMTPLEASYHYAQKLTRARATSFYYTFRFLPPQRRRSIFAVYAFSRRADDAVDAVEEHGTSPARARADLEQVRALLGPSPPDDPLVPALRDTMARYSIPLQPFTELLRGMEMDLEQKQYETFEELHGYCYRAASVIGLICIEIFGYSDAQARAPAIALGLAMQLTNILRDVAEDHARGRIYLPQEDLRRFGYGAEDLAQRIVDDRFRALMAFEVERAREYFRAAEPLYSLILPESRYCPVLLQRFYSRILDTIEARHYDVFSRRPSLRWHEKLLLAGKTWLEARRRQQ